MSSYLTISQLMSPYLLCSQLMSPYLQCAQLMSHHVPLLDNVHSSCSLTCNVHSSCLISVQFVYFESKRHAKVDMSDLFSLTTDETWRGIDEARAEGDHGDTESESGADAEAWMDEKLEGEPSAGASGEKRSRDSEQSKDEGGFQAVEVDSRALQSQRKLAKSARRHERNAKSRRMDAMLEETALEQGKLNIRTIEALTEALPGQRR